MKSRLWTRNFIVTTTANFLIYLVYYLLFVITANHAMNVLHASASEAGLASGLFILGGLAARLVSGRIIHSAGPRKILLTGLLIYLLTSLLYFTASTISILLIVRFLHGYGFGTSATATATIVAEALPEERKGEGIAYYSLSMTLASALGPLAGVLLNQHSSFNVILMCSTGLTVICLFVSIFVKLPGVSAGSHSAGSHSAEGLNAEGPAARVPAARKPSIHDFLEKSAVPISIVTFVIIFTYTSILAFMAKFAESTGIGSMISASSIFFLVYSLFVLMSRPITGRLFDKYGENSLIYPSIVVFAVGLAMLGFASNGFVMLCSAALVGLGYGTFFSSANAVAIKASPSGRVHLATTTYFSFVDLGGGVGPFVLGVIITATGFRELYFVMGGVTLCCLALYYFLHGRSAARAKL